MFTPNEGMLKAMYKAARRQRFRDNMTDFGNDLNYNLQRNLRGSNSNEDLIKGALSAGATAAFGPVGGLAAGFLGNALFPQEQETVVNPRVERNLNPYGMAQGGMVQQNMVPVEVEGDEMFELPNGQVGEFDGPNHEQGGIPTALPAGTNVYSKRVRGEDGRTMADRKESREKRLKKILEQLKKRPADAPTRNAVSREVERIEQEEQQDMQIMQMYQLRDMLAQARQEQMMQGQMQGQMQQGQMSPEMMQQAMQQQQMQQGQMQGQMSPEMMQGEMPMMEAGGVLFPGLEEGMAYPDTLQEYKLIQSIDDPQQSQMDELNNKKASRLFNKLGNQYEEIAKTYQDKLSPLFEESETANSSSLEMMPELSEMAYGGLIMPMFEAGGTVRGEFLESFNPGDYSDKNKVREVQETLAEAGYDLPNSTTKSGSYDGVWGEETQRAYDNYMAERSNPENLGPTPASDNRVFDPLAVRYEADLPEVTVTAKRMNKLNWDNYLQAAEKYLSLRNNIEGFTPEDLVNPIKEHYEKTGRLFPLELLMVNMQNEGSFNKDGGRSKWTNPVNWGEYDSGTKLKFKHPQEAIAAYIRGMDKSYLQEGKVSVDDLMQNFVNKRGYRYATDTRYEEKGRQTLNKIRNQLKDFDLSEQANIIQPELPESTVVQAEMPRESTAVSMPMMQAGGVIRNGNTMNGFTDLAMLLGGYNKMAAGGTTPMMSDDYINQFANYQLPVMAAGGNVRPMNVMPTEPPKINVEDLILKIVQYEEQQGSENFGNKFTDKKFDSAEDAAEWITKNLLPHVPEKYKSPYEKAAYLDFLYDTQLNPEFYFNYVYYGDNRDDPGKLAEMRAREGSLKKLTLDDVKKGRIFKDKKKDKEWGLSGWQKEQGFKDEDREDGRDYVFEETIDRGNAFNRLRTMNAARFQYYKHHNEEGRRLNERTDADEIATNENLTNNYNRLINTSTPDSIEETPFLDENAPAGSYDFRNVNAIAGQNVFVQEIDKLQDAFDYYNELKSKQKPGEPLSYELKQVRDYLINEIDAYGSMLRPTDQNFIQNNPFGEYGVVGIESVVDQYQGIATELETEIQGEIDQLAEQGRALDPEKDFGVMQEYKYDINRLRKKVDRINENTTYVTENVIPSYSGQAPATPTDTIASNNVIPEVGSGQPQQGQQPVAQAPAGTQQGQAQGQAAPTGQQPTTQAPPTNQAQPTTQAPPTNQGIDPLAESIATRRSGELNPPSADNVVENINIGDQAGQANAASQPNQLREHLRKILEYEKNHGSADGTALPNFGNKAAGKTFKDEEEALDWIMETIVPQIPEGLSTVEQLAWADFLYNSGKDPRVWAVQEYLQKYDPDSKELENGELKGRKDMFIAMDKGTYEGSEDEERINKIYEDVMALPAKERLKLFNAGREFYYRNLTLKGEKPLADHPLGALSNAFQNTWYPRILNSSTLKPFRKEDIPVFSEKTKDQFSRDTLSKIVDEQFAEQDQPTASDDLDTLVELEAANPSLVDDLITDLTAIPPAADQNTSTDLNTAETVPDQTTPTAPAFDMYNFDKTDPEQVKIVQERLDDLGYPMDKSIKADGTYDGVWKDGEQTAEAYKQWMQDTSGEPGFTGYGLDGNVMPSTELTTGTPGNQINLDLDPTVQEQTLEQALAELEELNQLEDLAKKSDLYNKGAGSLYPSMRGSLDEIAKRKEEVAKTINQNVGSSPIAYPTLKGLFPEKEPSTTTPTTPEAEKTEPQWKSDPLSTAGVITSGVSPLVATILNRLGDKENINFYANYGRDAERALDAAERGIAGGRDRGFEENRLAQNLRARQARNAARSSNVMQAMQQAALTSGMKANEQLTGQYQNALRTLLGNRAQFEQAQDQAVMRGREAAFTADVKDRDQFYTNLASNLANVGSMFQTLGRQKEVFDVFNDPNRNTDDKALFLQLRNNALAPLSVGNKTTRSSNSGS